MNCSSRCPICTSDYEDPRVLRCLHTICLRCLEDSCSAPLVLCPLCGFTTETLSLHLLPRNYEVIAYLRESAGKKSCLNCDTKEAVVYCQECQSFLCLGCSEKVHANAIFRHHRVADIGFSTSTTATSNASVLAGDESSSRRERGIAAISETPPSSMQEGSRVFSQCPRHKQFILSIFCTQCHVSGCAQCSKEYHHGHNSVVSLELMAKKVMCQLPEAIDSCELLKDRTGEAIGNVECAIMELNEVHLHEVEKINSYMDKVKRELELRHSHLLSQLQDARDKKMEVLEQQKERLREVQLFAAFSAITATALCPEQLLQQQQQQQREKQKRGGLSTSPSPHDHVSPYKNINNKNSGISSSFSPQKSRTKDTEFALRTLFRTPSSICEIGCTLSEYLDYLKGQHIDDTPCVDAGLEARLSDEDVVREVRRFGSVVVPRQGERVFPCHGTPGEHGILYYLGTARGTQAYINPCLSGAIKIQASSLGYGKLDNIVNSSPGDFCTQNCKHSWVALQLECNIRPTHYSLSHDTYEANSHFLRNWELEGWSEQDAEWVVLASHVDDMTLNAENTCGVWEIPQPLPSSLRCYKTATSTTSTNNKKITTIETRKKNERGGENRYTAAAAVCNSAPLRIGGFEEGEKEEEEDVEREEGENERTAQDVAGRTNQSLLCTEVGCRRLRIRQTGANSHGTHFLMLSAVEFFGTLLGA